MSEFVSPHESKFVVLTRPPPYAVLFAVFIVAFPIDFGFYETFFGISLRHSKSLKRPPAMVLGVMANDCF